MFTQKIDHKHEFVDQIERTRVTLGGVDIPYVFKKHVCMGKGCSYIETYDMVPVDEDVPRLLVQHTEVVAKKSYRRKYHD
jgi:hypothetical protein